MLEQDLTAVFEYLQGMYREDRGRIFTEVIGRQWFKLKRSRDRRGSGCTEGQYFYYEDHYGLGETLPP